MKGNNYNKEQNFIQLGDKIANMDNKQMMRFLIIRLIVSDSLAITAKNVAHAIAHMLRIFAIIDSLDEQEN